MKTVTVNVPGIQNNQMKTSLKNALHKIEGVRSVDVDRTLGTVEIEYSDPTRLEQIEDCIQTAGFKDIFS